ncbi:ShlB/FhaC/HecB family hemolysin secretion/activation protein [Desmonostoc muscorum]|uniref:ShlB/FhaC/HecB family hemolysin secretion/activation protein n=1 Tax=Desmonostoc muscorum TaxID=1179 RepID=UPI001F400875|nr:ShlB/FhaC/HecB family hemolysin secretion/activation protein [Desmonostoc muscorum]
MSAQSTPPPGVNIPPTIPETLDETIPKPNPPATPPPTAPSASPPILTSPDTPTPSDTNFPSSESFLVKKVEVFGTTVLKDEIGELIKRFENRQVTFGDLIQLRSDITELYIKKGYVTSGAFLPNNQNLTDGVVEIQVVEGQLEKIELGGLRRLEPVYVRSRLQKASSAPLNQKRLEEALQLLQLDPLIERVNAQLTAGSTPGSNILQVIITEAPAFHGGVFAANNQTPSIGSTQAGVFLSHDNLLGFGDSLSAEYGITEGLNIYNISYTIPINANNGTLAFRVNNSDSRIIEDQFRDLDIKSEAQTYSFNYRQPLYRKPQSEFAIGLGLDLRRSQTFLFNDIPFSFSEGPENGLTKVTVIRFSQDWVERSATRVLAVRSQFSLGIGAFDATVNDLGTDGRFFSWLGQFQWVQRLSPRTILLTRLNAQFTGDSLLSLEKFSIGGVDTVRGYRQNEFVADNGITGSVEARIPITSSNALQIAPFFDVGTAWNNGGNSSNSETFASLGLGLIWQPIRDFNLRLDYGIPLIDVNREGNTLQDNGFSFSLRYQPF